MYEKKDNMVKPRIDPLDESFSSYLMTGQDVTPLTISFSSNFDSKESQTDPNINNVKKNTEIQE